jgi:membrane protein, antimicrobial resistance system
MPNTSTQSGAGPAPKSLPARVIGVITSPRETFQSIVAHPKWFGMLALTTLAMAVLLGAFLSTAVGQDAWLEAATSSPWSGQVSDQQYERMQAMAKFAGIMGAVQVLIFVPLITVIVAGLLYAIFNAAMGGDATFKQVLAVVTHASAVSIVGQLFTVPLNYARGTMSSATNLAVLLPMVDDRSFFGRLLGTIDLFIIWYVVVLAIGLAVLYRRRTQSIAITLFGIYAVIALAIAAIMSRVGSA